LRIAARSNDPAPGRDLVRQRRDRVRNPRIVMAVYTRPARSRSKRYRSPCGLPTAIRCSSSHKGAPLAAIYAEAIP
jgi:hypothetical protein